MKRRDFVTSVIATGIAAPVAANQNREHEHEAVTGPLASAVVAFGAWKTQPALDRFPNVPPAPSANAHLLFPFEARIKAGGSVSFVISGLHNIQIFGPGTEEEDINIGLTIPMTAPPGLPIINDPTNRVYRGADPSVLLPVLDRVEVVQLTRPGRYLVICGVLVHFQDGMHGYVNVVR
jgi:hypothetical protein